MRISLFAPGYPSDKKPYAHGFVHVRGRLYRERGHEVQAFVIGERSRYEIDGIRVTTGDSEDCARGIAEARTEVLAIHQPSFRMIAAAERMPFPQATWLHGSEVMWSLHTVHFASGPLSKATKLLKALPRNVMQMTALRRFLPTQRATVFVSQWLRSTAESHVRVTLDNAVVIPNPVDVDLFSYRLDPKNKSRGVTTRSLSSSVYGLDVAVRAFGGAPASLTMVGTGTLEKKLRRLIRRTGSQTVIDARQLHHREMPELFGRYGFFVAPSRREAQGVSMCEAMACGLPVVATRVGGIPEYVTHNQEGLLVPRDDPDTLRGAVIDLLRDESRYLAMSKAARARMERQCAPDVVIERELQLLARAASV